MLRSIKLLVAMLGCVAMTLPAEAQEEPAAIPANEVPMLSELDQPATSIDEWMAQVAQAAVVKITAVRVEPTETGLAIVLETEGGSIEVPATNAIGNALIADIPNATIAEEIFEPEPIAGIALVEVTQLPGDRVRVAITGTDAPPVAEVRSDGQNLVLGVAIGTVAAQDEEAIEIVVTGDQDDDYQVDTTSVGTRTDTPLRDVPQAIQVIPQQVLEDQQARSIIDGLQNAVGLTALANPSSSRTYFTIRGFENFGNFLVNGIPDPQISSDATFINVERLEVLRGPASVLYGQTRFSGLGGTINVVTRQPLRNPFYEVSATAASFNDYQGAIDFSGPLNDARTVRYRFIAGYQDFDSFLDFEEGIEISVAPSLALELGENTDLTIEGDVNIQERNGQQPEGQPAVGTVLPNPNGTIDRSFNPGGPQVDNFTVNARAGYRFEHRFSEDWRIRNAFLYTIYDDDDRDGAPQIFNGSLAPDNRTLNRRYFSGSQFYDSYYLDTNLLGEFRTGTIDHQLLFGFSLSRDESDVTGEVGDAPPIDIFNPVYDQNVNLTGPTFSNFTTRDTLGLYLQDQVTLAENLRFLLGGRLDFFEERTDDRLADTETNQSDTAFSPRIGVVYQPIPAVSLYASYSRSFAPTIGLAADGETFRPERGTQYEIGAKVDINDQLSANLALYDLTRTNVTTADPDNPNFSIQTGEQRSQGIEVDINGEILPGWNVIAGYAYNDARVTEDNSIPEGNRLRNAPEHSFNLWTTYRIQAGDLEGLGFGLGFYFVGDRPGDLANSFKLPSYFRTDAAIFYERDRFRAAINIRNLFDIEYYPTADSINRVDVGAPFTVQGTLAWRF
ncbi:TonB-dependent siderophore receptor [Microcoleus sp. FACHB-1515]|uniref:TonB-dependent siderophore receptor n=1 Tax=Cyanophyceae TaxID=3028117 RepID=UPI001686BFC4|nr:TonB-dependent siderophore receptor [Microcoleus sp. FACHB-1515]MBD2091503.1 TonB-dependent siderophore receptor [Microcoleus sp. FACHB-1515]